MAHQRPRQRHIAWPIISVLVIFIILPGMIGCNTVTQGEVEISNPPAENTTPTIDDLFIPDEEYTPATIREYIEDARIADTNRIEYYDCELQEMISMNDQAVIDDFIEAL